MPATLPSNSLLVLPIEILEGNGTVWDWSGSESEDFAGDYSVCVCLCKLALWYLVSWDTSFPWACVKFYRMRNGYPTLWRMWKSYGPRSVQTSPKLKLPFACRVWSKFRSSQLIYPLTDHGGLYSVIGAFPLLMFWCSPQHRALACCHSHPVVLKLVVAFYPRQATLIIFISPPKRGVFYVQQQQCNRSVSTLVQSLAVVLEVRGQENNHITFFKVREIWTVKCNASCLAETSVTSPRKVFIFII